MMEVDSMQVLSLPSILQVNLQCKRQRSSMEVPLARRKFHLHKPSDPHAYPTRAKHHAIALTNLCPVGVCRCSAAKQAVEK